MRFLNSVPAFLLAASMPAAAIELDITSVDSIKSATSNVAHQLMTYYHGNETGQIPGTLPEPYYWWECGAMFGCLIDYWSATGDTTYNDNVMQGMLFQVGANNDYMPQNRTKDEGNDDQVFWGFSAMTAAEYKFPDPPSGKPGWLALAQAVFNTMAARWDNTVCGEGLRWQIFTWNNGYDYKNSAANGGLMNLGARLYAYTGNETYADWANKSWDWMAEIGLISQGPDYTVFDGTQVEQNCTEINHAVFTYTTGMVLNGAAFMYNVTGSDEWKQRTAGLWTAAAKNFFSPEKIMYEKCEQTASNAACNNDMQSFKAYFSRFIASSAQLAPFLEPLTQPYLAASASAAAKQCSGGADGTACGMRWTSQAQYDGYAGPGEQMAALEVMLANVVQRSPAPVTHDTGGTSEGDPSAGTGATRGNVKVVRPVSNRDRAGAGILTALVLIAIIGGTWWLVV